MKFISIIIMLVLGACSQTSQKNIQSNKDTLVKIKNNSTKHVVKYYPLEKKLLIGDFDGDGKTDTLYQNNINSETSLPIDSLPELEEWDDIISYLDQNYSNIIITSSKNKADTLHLGAGFGLFCLINLGDLNHDKKDEFAFVTENADYSRVNHCYIYSICNKKFIQLKSFYIHEGSFDSYDNLIPKQNEIANFLEKQNGKWMYMDYLDDMAYENEKDVGKFKVLKLNKCK